MPNPYPKLASPCPHAQYRAIWCFRNHTAAVLSPITFKHPHCAAHCHPEDSSRLYWCETILPVIYLSVYISLSSFLYSPPCSNLLPPCSPLLLPFYPMFPASSPRSSLPTLTSSSCCLYYFLCLFFLLLTSVFGYSSFS